MIAQNGNEIWEREREEESRICSIANGLKMIMKLRNTWEFSTISFGNKNHKFLVSRRIFFWVFFLVFFYGYYKPYARQVPTKKLPPWRWGEHGYCRTLSFYTLRPTRIVCCCFWLYDKREYKSMYTSIICRKRKRSQVKRDHTKYIVNTQSKKTPTSITIIKVIDLS